MSTIAAMICVASQAFCPQMNVSVLDGDTIKIKSEKFRILGVDAPELKGKCQNEILKAAQAKDFLKQAIANARHVRIKRDGRDNWGRTLAYVTVDDEDIGQKLMKEGLAREWKRTWRQGIHAPWCAA